MNAFIKNIFEHKMQIDEWLGSHESKAELPLYSSVDIRDAGFKMSVVDTNLFPAGFNNLCQHGIDDASKILKQAIDSRVSNCRHILVLCEEHTRNIWYLENIRILNKIIEKAGFKTHIATFFNNYPDISNDTCQVTLETATGNNVTIYNIDRIVSDVACGEISPDLIIMNNDLSSGIPTLLQNLDIPIYPSIQAGWHARSKSHHFNHLNELITEFASLVKVDPWQFSTFNTTLENININDEKDRIKLADASNDLIGRIALKYTEYKINRKPFFFLKSDYGTYGMGVMSFSDPKDLLTINRKTRNKLYRGKSSRLITKYLLQEGVPTKCNINNNTCETCIYQITNQLVGGFYRIHQNKSSEDNLNSKGMIFKEMCPRLADDNKCGIFTDINIFETFRILSRIAGIAAHKEISQLEAQAL